MILFKYVQYVNYALSTHDYITCLKILLVLTVGSILLMTFKG